MAMDQEKDGKCKELAKKKRGALGKWREAVGRWLKEPDPMKRVSLRKQEEEASNMVAQAERELDAYVRDRGGY